MAVDNYALSKLDKTNLYNDSMIICTIHKKNININNKYSYKLNTKIRRSIDDNKQQQYNVLYPQDKHQHQQQPNNHHHHYQSQQWLPVKRQSTEWLAQNNYFKFDIDLYKNKNKTYHDFIQYKNNKSYHKRYNRYLQYLKYGWYEGYSTGFPGSEINRYTNNDNITSVPYGCWFDIIHDISPPTPQHHHHYHHNQHLQHDHDQSSSSSSSSSSSNDKEHRNVIWINIGKKYLININTVIIIITMSSLS